MTLAVFANTGNVFTLVDIPTVRSFVSPTAVSPRLCGTFFAGLAPSTANGVATELFAAVVVGQLVETLVLLHTSEAGTGAVVGLAVLAGEAVDTNASVGSDASSSISTSDHFCRFDAANGLSAMWSRPSFVTLTFAIDAAPSVETCLGAATHLLHEFVFVASLLHPPVGTATHVGRGANSVSALVGVAEGHIAHVATLARSPPRAAVALIPNAAHVRTVRKRFLARSPPPRPRLLDVAKSPAVVDSSPAAS